MDDSTAGSGSATGIPLLLLKLEGLAVLVLAVWLYGRQGGNWWLFALLLLSPDLSMFGYLGGPKVGALCYNAFHTYLGPAILGGVGLAVDCPTAISLSLIWIAHIGMDRVLGYGLKYPDAFGATHLGGKGKQHASALKS